MAEGKGLFTRLWRNFINSLFGESNVRAASLQDDAVKMQEGLYSQRDAVAQAMALAAQKKDELRLAVETHEKLRYNAKHFLARNQEAEATRCAELLIISEQRIKALTTQYQSLKTGAENAMTSFRRNADQVRHRLESLNQLQELQAFNRLRAEAQRTFDSFDMTSPVASFDRVAQAIQLESRKLDAGQELSEPDQAIIDERIAHQFQDSKVHDVLLALQAEAATEPANVFDTQVVLGGETVDRAKALLAEPKTQSFGAPVEHRMPVTVEARVVREEGEGGEK